MYRGLVTLVLLAGCATPREYDVILPENYSVQDSRQHLYECRLQSRAVLPGTTPYVHPNAGGFVGGVAQGYASAQRSRIVYDNNLITECLQAKGYRFVPRGNKESLPDTEWVPNGYRLVR